MNHGASDTAERRVQRNTLYLVLAQVVVVPLSVITNVLVARFLGPSDFGHLYLATTFASFGFLFVEFGQGGALAGMVATQRQRTGELLGSSLAWRALALIPVSAVLFAAALALGYPRDVISALALMLVICAFGTVSMACHDALRGHERTDIGAITFVGWKLLIVVAAAWVLLVHGNLTQLLLAQALCTAIGAVVMVVLMRVVHVTGMSVRRDTVKELVLRGWPFLVLALVLALQESVDAAYLAKLASPAAVGWHAAARKLIGLLVYPANALLAALYPTLSRLKFEDQGGFVGAGASALRTTVLLAVPLAFGCLLFPELGIWVFDRVSFGPTATNLRILSVYLLLVYLSMPLGTFLMVAGQQRAWVALQLMCVAISAVLDPWLIPLCEARFGNGGLGVCISLSFSELLMVGGAFWLAPKQLFGPGFARNTAFALLGGVAMVLAAVLLRGLSAWFAAPVALLAYALVQMAFGVVDRKSLVQLLARG